MTTTESRHSDRKEGGVGTTVVLDTCVLLADPDSLYAFGDADIVIPLTVIEELDGHKSRLDDVGRAARHVEGQVIMYADQMTDSMRKAISETERRRGLQAIYNEEHGIDPQTIRKKVSDILEMIRGRTDEAPLPAKGRRRQTAREVARRQELLEMPHDELGRLILSLEEEMHEAAAELRFEYAARLRDEINDLKRELREAG